MPPSSRALRPLITGQYPQKGAGLLGDRVEKNERRAMRFSVPSFPVSQRSQADAERRGELFLGQAGFFPHLLDVDFLRGEKPNAGFLPLWWATASSSPRLMLSKRSLIFSSTYGKVPASGLVVPQLKSGS